MLFRSVFHYLNRMVSVYLGDSPLPADRFSRGAATSVLAKRIANVAAVPGESLALLPSASVPEWLGWARENPSVAEAFTRFHNAVEKASPEFVSCGVRELVESRLAGWNGEDPGLSTAWCDDTVSSVPPKERPAAKLALLTALAAYRVDDATVAAYRATQQIGRAHV